MLTFFMAPFIVIGSSAISLALGSGSGGGGQWHMSTFGPVPPWNGIFPTKGRPTFSGPYFFRFTAINVRLQVTWVKTRKATRWSKWSQFRGGSPGSMMGRPKGEGPILDRSTGRWPINRQGRPLLYPEWPTMPIPLPAAKPQSR